MKIKKLICIIFCFILINIMFLPISQGENALVQQLNNNTQLLNYTDLNKDNRNITYDINIKATANANTEEQYWYSDYNESNIFKRWHIGETGASTCWNSGFLDAYLYTESSYVPDIAKSQVTGHASITALATENSISVSESIVGELNAKACDGNPYNGPGSLDAFWADATAQFGNEEFEINIPYIVTEDCFMTVSINLYILGIISLPRPVATTLLFAPNTWTQFTDVSNCYENHYAKIAWTGLNNLSANGVCELNEKGIINYYWEGDVEAGENLLKVIIELRHEIGAHANPYDHYSHITFSALDGFSINIDFY